MRVQKRVQRIPGRRGGESAALVVDKSEGVMCSSTQPALRHGVNYARRASSRDTATPQLSMASLPEHGAPRKRHADFVIAADALRRVRGRCSGAAQQLVAQDVGAVVACVGCAKEEHKG